MKTKLEMAHDWYMKHATNYYDVEVDIESAWEYADAMQAEADKRKPDRLSEDLKEEWQPDWSQAPEWANWWYVTNKNNPKWCSKKPYQDGCNWFVGANKTYSLHDAPSFGYTGNWQDSLRERPE